MLSPAHAHTHTKVFGKVINCTHFFEFTFLLLNCLCLIKMCAYSHVTVIQRVVTNYYIEVTLISILILKSVDSTTNCKGFFLSPVYKHLKCIFAYRVYSVYITCLELFMSAFCHTYVENLQKGPA